MDYSVNSLKNATSNWYRSSL